MTQFKVGDKVLWRESIGSENWPEEDPPKLIINDGGDHATVLCFKDGYIYIRLHKNGVIMYCLPELLELAS